jgi:predicted acylesterase/phospholipase RssA
LLCGWTEKGDRPEFEVVTGISTGALTAPFAFLGPEYDPVLREVYTTISTSSVLRKRGWLGAVLTDALADNQPLWRLMRKHVDQNLLNAVAAEYEKGRLLLVGTVNLDARRSVVWDIGAIAASKRAGSLELVHSILIASAAIPAAFPPVMIDVEVDGNRFQEMHVDGGCLHEVFLYPTSYVPLASTVGVTRVGRVYVIRNSRVDPEWAAVERRTLTIAGRAISALIHSQGLGDLDRMFLTARRDEMDFNLAHIPADFNEVAKEPFDREYMQKLFDVGFALAKDGDPWSKLPPGYVETKGK